MEKYVLATVLQFKQKSSKLCIAQPWEVILGFKHNLKVDSSLDRYKAHWVLRGFTQLPDVDYDETFSPVVKSVTVHTVLTLTVSRGWHVHHLDINNTFLHNTLSETFYCS
jgi:hypothetical protein